MSDVLGNTVCVCGCSAVPVKNAKGGALSSKCPDCGAQTMIKSPDAVAKWRAKFGTKPASKAAPTSSDDSLLNI
jgi:hypothetical protein